MLAGYVATGARTYPEVAPTETGLTSDCQATEVVLATTA